MPATALSQVGQLASMRRVHEAFRWLHLQEQRMMRWQLELVAIPAPPFAEQQRAAWLRERFLELAAQAGPGSAGLTVTLDEVGNVLAALESAGAENSNSPILLVSAHIDTVFPSHTPIEPILSSTRLEAPGACDNGAGVVALLALAGALLATGLEPGSTVIFAGNVGEEGEGDLRGMRHIYASPWSSRIAGHLVLDGAGHEIAVTEALGSERFEVTVNGAGGHSWTDAGRPNPIVALSEAIARMHRDSLAREPAPEKPADTSLTFGATRLSPTDAGCPTTDPMAQRRERSAWNVGTIAGGSSVNAIAEQATARFDLRSTAPEALVRMQAALYRAVEDAVLAANVEALAGGGAGRHPLRFTINSIGSRPAGGLRPGARILELLRGVDRHLGLRTDCRTASTDANIPLSLGVEAISLGAGGDGGGIHTRSEWYDAKGRELGLKRVLLLLLALAAEQQS